MDLKNKNICVFWGWVTAKKAGEYVEELKIGSKQNMQVEGLPHLPPYFSIGPPWHIFCIFFFFFFFIIIFFFYPPTPQ